MILCNVWTDYNFIFSLCQLSHELWIKLIYSHPPWGREYYKPVGLLISARRNSFWLPVLILDVSVCGTSTILQLIIASMVGIGL